MPAAASVSDSGTVSQDATGEAPAPNADSPSSGSETGSGDEPAETSPDSKSEAKEAGSSAIASNPDAEQGQKSTRGDGQGGTETQVRNSLTAAIAAPDAPDEPLLMLAVVGGDEGLDDAARLIAGPYEKTDAVDKAVDEKLSEEFAQDATHDEVLSWVMGLTSAVPPPQGRSYRIRATSSLIAGLSSEERGNLTLLRIERSQGDETIAADRVHLVGLYKAYDEENSEKDDACEFEIEADALGKSSNGQAFLLVLPVIKGQETGEPTKKEKTGNLVDSDQKDTDSTTGDIQDSQDRTFLERSSQSGENTQGLLGATPGQTDFTIDPNGGQVMFTDSHIHYAELNRWYTTAVKADWFNYNSSRFRAGVCRLQRNGYACTGVWSAPVGGTMIMEAVEGSAGYFSLKAVEGDYWHYDSNQIEAYWQKQDPEITLYAQWNPNHHQLTLDFAEGTRLNAPPEGIQPYDLIIDRDHYWAITPVSRTGYKFKGWFTEPVGGVQTHDDSGTCIDNPEYWTSDHKYHHDDDLTLYAQWEPISYVVHYDANGGTGTMDDSDFQFDEPQQLRQNMFKRPGYRFAGWDIQIYHNPKEVGKSQGASQLEWISYDYLEDVFQRYGTANPYTYVFDAKSLNIANRAAIEIYLLNDGDGNTPRYCFAPIRRVSFDVTEEYATYTISTDVAPTGHTNTHANVCFYGQYGTGNAPWVKDLHIRTVVPDMQELLNATCIDGETITAIAQWEPLPAPTGVEDAHSPSYAWMLIGGAALLAIVSVPHFVIPRRRRDGETE